MPHRAMQPERARRAPGALVVAVATAPPTASAVRRLPRRPRPTAASQLRVAPAGQPLQLVRGSRTSVAAAGPAAGRHRLGRRVVTLAGVAVVAVAVAPTPTSAPAA